jgi:hypothetical protein
VRLETGGSFPDAEHREQVLASKIRGSSPRTSPASSLTVRKRRSSRSTMKVPLTSPRQTALRGSATASTTSVMPISSTVARHPPRCPVGSPPRGPSRTLYLFSGTGRRTLSPGCVRNV